MRDVTFSLLEKKLKSPFSITGKTFTEIETLVCTIKEDDITAQGEGLGIFYFGETGRSILYQAKSLQVKLEHGLDRVQLQQLLPRGGARNAIDCALWDLETKLSGQSIWGYTGITPSSVISLNTIGVDTPTIMAAKALELETPQIKVKLDANDVINRISAVRQARPDATIVIDVNQGWNLVQLKEYVDPLKVLNIAMIEQPLPRGEDAELEFYDSPIPLCADESCLDTADLPEAAKRYQMINIKLDKTGGLTEALKLAEQCKVLGKDIMVGNMMGTSLSMAPAYVIAQLCRYADLDGALFIKEDCQYPMLHNEGTISAPTSALWG